MRFEKLVGVIPEISIQKRARFDELAEVIGAGLPRFPGVWGDVGDCAGEFVERGRGGGDN